MGQHKSRAVTEDQSLGIVFTEFLLYINKHLQIQPSSPEATHLCFNKITVYINNQQFNQQCSIKFTAFLIHFHAKRKHNVIK
jgi:hypothetical protein